MPLDGLAIAIGSRTADVKSGIASVRASLGRLERNSLEAALGMRRAGESADDLRDDSLSLAGALQLLAGRADHAEDQIDSAGRSALTTSGMFSTMTLSTEGLSFSLRSLSGAIMLGLVPALVTLSGALVPLIGAMGGFLAVAGAIAGVGLVGAIGGIATHTEELKQEFMTMVGVLKDEFAPVFDMAATVLSILINTFEDVIPALVPTQEAVEHIAGNFAVLGTAIIEALPAFVDLAVTLTREFLPPFVTWAQDVLPQVPGMLDHLATVFRRVLPFIMGFGRTIGELWPDLLEFGFAALNVVAPALGRLAAVVQDGLQFFNALDPSIQDVALRLSLLAPAIGTVISILSGPAILAAAGFAAAWMTNFGDIRTTSLSAFGDIKETIEDGLSSIKENLGPFKQSWKDAFGAVETAVGIAFDALLGLLNFVVDAFLTGISVVLDILAGDWEGAFSQIKGFTERTLNGLLGFARKWGSAFINNIVAGIGSAIKNLPKEARVLLATFTPLSPGALKGLGTLAAQQGAPTSVQSQQVKGIQRGQPPQVRVEVTGDTGVVKDVAVEVVDEKNRKESERFGRLTGTQG